MDWKRGKEEVDKLGVLRAMANWKSDEEMADIMKITPAIAQELLCTSAGNRRKRGWYVSLLASAMKRGEWRITSQGIGVDKEGRLLDAHHRLYACIESGVTFKSVIVVGLRKDAFEVIDVGMRRNMSDLLREDQRIAEVIRLGIEYATGKTRPTVDQVRRIIGSKFTEAVKQIIESCGTKLKYFSSASIKLAAVISIMNGGDISYVLTQYRAMLLLDYDAMSPSAKALVRQVTSGKVDATNKRDSFARGMCVFDKSKSSISKIQIKDGFIDSCVLLAKQVILDGATVT